MTEPFTAEAVTYLGTDRKGAGVGGVLVLVTGATLGIFVERKFKQGWKSLTVKRGGRVVGEVFQASHKRVWWSE